MIQNTLKNEKKENKKGKKKKNLKIEHKNQEFSEQHGGLGGNAEQEEGRANLT
jgi:hypothetical protein